MMSVLTPSAGTVTAAAPRARTSSGLASFRCTWTQIEKALSQCDLFIAIGTSGLVYPAAGFVQLAKHAGARTIEVNLESSAVVSHFDKQRLGRASETVPQLVEELLHHQVS